MLMIPITFLPAIGLLLVAVWIATRQYRQLPAPWLIAFLCSLAVQLFLLGTRHGYGVDAVLSIQHMSGVVIPPLGYLAFTNPRVSARLGVHILPGFAMGLVVAVLPRHLDVVLAGITFGYAIALLFALRRNRDSMFSWAPLAYMRRLQFALYVTVAALVLSGLTDALVAVDFAATGGARLRMIVAVASFAGVLLLLGCVAWFLRQDTATPVLPRSAEDEVLLNRLTDEIKRKDLFRDPDLTLSRLAKRLALPARDVSRVVNRATGLNMSQFINNMRIEAVCEQLKSPDVSVTAAMLDAGFYTKSNFNREFRRVMGQTPTEWRSGKCPKDQP